MAAVSPLPVAVGEGRSAPGWAHASAPTPGPWGPSLGPGSAQLSLLLLGPVWVSSFLSMANEGCPSWRGLCPAVSTTPAAVQGGREPRRTKLAFLPGFLEPYPLGREHSLSDAQGP